MHKRSLSWLRVLAILFLGVVVLPSIAFAQTGTISGTVEDSAGAVVPDAQVTVRNTATNVSRQTTTGGSGTFTLTQLAVGPYEITVIKSGFKTFRVPAVQLTVAQALSLNAKLELGAVSEEVQVRGDVLQEVDLETSQLSNLVDTKQMQSLPLITRNPYQLVLLSPGTSQTDSSSGGFSVNGARDRNNNFLLDGVDNNDTSVPGNQGGVLNANPDSTEEFRVITDNFNPEYGRNVGAIIDVVTKSGTNTFHGGAYYFGRWNGFGGARDWFNPATGPNGGPMNPYIRHQFGFSIGGPIIKNKTFFFFNDEMDRFRTTLTNSSTVPTAAFLTGRFNYTYTDGGGVNHTVPVDLTPTGANNAFGVPFDPTMLAVLGRYPVAPQSADGIDGNIFFPTTSAQNSYNPTIKIDHHINDRESLSLRYGYNHLFDPNGFHTDILPGGVGAIATKDINQGLAAHLTSTLSNNLINDFRFGWNHVYATFYHTKATTSVLDAPGGTDSFGNGWDYLLDPFTDFSSQLGGSNSQNRKTGTVSYSESIAWVRGDHTLKFGFDFRNVGESGFNNFSSRRQLNLRPALSFQFDPGLVDTSSFPAPDPSPTLIDAANALYGLIIQDSQSQFFNKAGTRVGTDDKFFRQHEWDFFGQDSWKVRRNLTVNFGLRYQYNGVPFEQSGNFSNLLQNPSTFATGSPVVFSLVGPGSGRSLYKPDYNDIEPRIGFTWDPWSNGKTAIRGGFGVFHDRVFGNAFGNARANPPFQVSYSQFPVDFFGSAGVPSQIPTQTPSASIPDGALVPGFVIFSDHFPNTASNSWNFDIQRELAGNNVFDVAYVGTMGVHIYGQADGNPPDPALVQQLVTFCSTPGNSFVNEFGQTRTCTPSQVSGTALYSATGDPNSAFGTLPFNAVNNNALLQPDYQLNEFNSIYHAMQAKFTHRMSQGVQVQAAYTWSHSLDNSVDPLTPAVGARTFPRNSRNFAQSYGNSDNDTRHVGVINYIWDLPFGKGKSRLSDGVVGRILEGMELSGIFTVQSGHPFNVRGTRDSQRTGIAAWGYQVGDPFAAPSDPNCAPQAGLGFVYLKNQCAFTNAPFGSPSNNPRNNFYGPGFWNWDMSLSKTMTITENVKAELRFEGYNIFNHPHFLNPGTDNASNGNLISSPLFGIVTNTYTQPDGTTSARQIQVALKVHF